MRSIQAGVLTLLLGFAAVLNAASEGDLFRAARTGQVPAIQAALKAGANINTRFDIGKTALIVAAERGHVAAVDALMSAGADLYVLDNNGWDALAHAVVGLQTQTVRLMLSKGYDPSANNWKAYTVGEVVRPRLGTHHPVFLAMDEAKKNYRGRPATTASAGQSGAVATPTSQQFLEEQAEPVFVDISERSITPEIYNSAATKVLAGRGWNILTNESGQITAALTKDREYRVRLSFKAGVVIKIGFVEGYGSSRSNWLNNLKKDLESHL